MRATIVVDPLRLRSWVQGLVQRLEEAGWHVEVQVGTERPLPGALELFLDLQRVAHRRPFAGAAARIEFSDLLTHANQSPDTPDVVIDLSSGETLLDESVATAGARVLRVLYDGDFDEAQLYAALLAGDMPTIEIADARTGIILARGLPARDEARSIAEAAEAVYYRASLLLMTVIEGKATSLAPLPAHRQTASTGRILMSQTKGLARTAARALYQLCCHTPHWQIGWRFVDGNDVWDTHRLGPTPWQTLPDPGTHFYADPFPIVWRGRTFVFFEDYDHATGKGIISMTEFDDRGPIGAAQPVLEEPWHLSYPHLICDGGEVWMIPESSADRAVHLYRADPFPFRWRREATLLTGITGSDATIVKHGGQYWMFLATREDGGSHSDTLSLFHASSLEGPWIAHAANPVLVDRTGARPAGNLVVRNGKLWRPVQDCSSGYGSALGLAEVLRLDEGGYSQVVRSVLRPGAEWPGRKLHTLNRAGRLECIDGSAIRPKSRFLKRGLSRWTEPASRRALALPIEAGLIGRDPLNS